MHFTNHKELAFLGDADLIDARYFIIEMLGPTGQDDVALAWHSLLVVREPGARSSLLASLQARACRAHVDPPPRDFVRGARASRTYS